MAKHKLLLADDSITIQKVVNLTFADEGIEVISVGDGNAAMEKLAEMTPDLIMVDINMPGLTGYEICERIRGNEATRHIPVILLVGSFEPFDEEEARRVGANDFLTKPFQSIRQLVTKVSGLLDSAADSTETSTGEIISDLETPETNPVTVDFEDTLRMPKAAAAPEEFGDTGMDDEMIQTNQVGGFGLDETAKFQSKSETDSETDDTAKTQPLSTAELDEISSYQSSEQMLSQDEQAVSESAERGFAVVGDTAFSAVTPVSEEESFDAEETAQPPIENQYFYQAEQPSAENQYFNQNDYSNQPQEAQFVPTAETDSALELEDEGNLLELPPQESMSAAAASQPVWQEDVAPIDDSIEPNQDTQATETSEITQFAPNDEVQEVAANETAGENQFEASDETYETQVKTQETTDDEKPSETAPDETAAEAVTAEVIDTNQIESSETEAMETTSETAATLSLSPDVIEAIAAKISERFSDEIIREIVAEITPQITELIARRIAEENSRE